MRVCSRHCTGVALAASIALGLSGPAAAQQEDGPAIFRVFLRGTAVGNQQVLVRHTAAGWTLTGSGHLGPPLDLTTKRLELTYDEAWRPLELTVDASTKGATISIHTTFSGTRAQSEVNQSGVVTRKTDTVAADTLVLPNLFFGSYEALALRLASIPDGGSFKAYVAPQAEITVKQNARSSQRIETAKRVVDVRTYALTFQNPGAPIDATIWTDEAGRLVRFEVSAQSLLVVREDFASVASRAQVMSRAGDLSISIPANGFNLAGTLSQPSGSPPAALKGRYPAVVLVTGSGPADRDETVAGIPIFAQLAGTLADAGYYVLRYDKRGVGQSGGRPESATLDDYAEDVLAAVKFLRERKDVDRRHIALVGHSEGAWTALIAAGREHDIAALVMVAGPSGSGADLVLEQQQYLLNRSALSPADRQAKIDLQKRIQAAVLGKGDWMGIPMPLRQQADTAWFRSFLAFSPATLMPKVKQPILIVQGDLDRQVNPYHADKLAALARARKKTPAERVEVAHFDGVNHLLIPAKTGDIEEYAHLPTKVIDPRVAEKIVAWLGSAMAPRQ
jgi:dipeptidyl aminopeptidase/acylaminoacyl peptidase